MKKTLFGIFILCLLVTFGTQVVLAEDSCEDPYVLFEGECTDPVPPCLDSPEGALFCIDKIENGERIERYDFTCYDEWEKTDDGCENPCDEPFIPIDGKCIDPYPACEELPANVEPSSCINKIYPDGSVSELWSFNCLPGYEKNETKFLCESRFSDVHESTYYADAIMWMAGNEVINGYDDGTFGPDKCVNRVELLRMLLGILEVDENEYAGGDLFFDTYENQWYTNYVKAGKARGTVNGYGDGTFHPDQCVNKVEAIKMAVLEFNDGEVPTYGAMKVLPEDVKDESQWYYPFTKYAFFANLVPIDHLSKELSATSNSYYYVPAASMTRKEVSEMLYRMKAVYDNDLDYSEDLFPNMMVEEEDL